MVYYVDMNVYVCNPHGYCKGVVSAINLVLATKESNPNTAIYVLGMLVHNKDVIDMLSKKGIITLDIKDRPIKEIISSLPTGSILVFTAHGHDIKLDALCKEKGIKIVDATCGMVKYAQDIIKNSLLEGNEIIYIGKKGHPETNAAISLGKNIFLYDISKPKSFDYTLIKTTSPLIINQTTLSIHYLANIIAEIKSKIKSPKIVDEICDATRMRQNAVKSIPLDVDIIYVVGGKMSSNTKELAIIASSTHKNAKVIQIENIKDIKEEDLKDKKSAAIASGASTPFEI